MSRTQLDYLVVVLANTTIPAVLLLDCYSGGVTASIASVAGAVSSVVLNTVFLVAVNIRQGRDGQKLPRNLAILTVLMGISSAGITAAAVGRIPVRNDLIRLAYSAKPLDEIQPEQERLAVKLLRQRAVLSDNYDRVLASTRPLSPALYSLESFATPASIRATSAAIKTAAVTELQYADQVQQATLEFRRDLTRIDPNSQYLKGWQDTENQERTHANIEKEWLSGVIALYEYAANHVLIKSTDGRLIFASDEERIEFMRQLERSKAVHEKLMSEVQKSLAAHQRAQTAFGIGKYPGSHSFDDR